MGTRITELLAQADKSLHQFELTRNAAGQAPWEEYQDRQRKKNLVKAGAGAAAVGAGAYGARKLWQNYGGPEGAPVKEVARNVGQAALRTGNEMVQRGRDAVGGAAQRTGTYVRKAGKEAFKRGKASWNMSGVGTVTDGVRQVKPFWDRAKMVGKAALRGVRAVKFSRLDRLVQLEAILDEGLQKFEQR